MTKEQIAMGKEDPVPVGTATDDVETLQANPEYATLELTLETLRKKIADIDQKIGQNEKAIETYNQYVNQTPQGAQELTEALRENNNLFKEHQEMSARLAAARLSASAADKQGNQFTVYDEASLPELPTKPSKPKIRIAGVALSLLIGVGLAFLVDIAKQKTWTQSDITHLLGVKVLAEVPRITMRNAVTKAQKRKVGFVTSVGLASIAYGFVLYFAYVHSGFVLRQLDPLIQKLY